MKRTTGTGALVMVSLSFAIIGGCAEQGGFTPTAPDGSGAWHIVVARFRGEGHYETAKWVYESLVPVKGLDPGKLKLYHERDATMIAYGRYQDTNDARARKDLALIKNLVVPDRGALFLDADFEPVPEPDPALRKEWLLANSGGYWTLEIARFDGPSRKLAAVEMVKHLRSEGVPAYVWHGVIRSTVTVGAFKPEAVGTARPRGRIPIISMRPVALDPELKKWQERFPDLMINASYITLRSAGGERASRLHSKIIRVPEPGGSLW